MNTEFFLGCSGYHYNHWKKLFYPEKLSKTKWLQYYAKYFNTVEINNTFYQFPRESTLKGWYDRTPKHFKFILKANRSITHTRKFHNTKELTERFYKLADVLREKLACILFQLPPFIHKNLELLEKIAGQIDPKIINILEFRHESWWDNEVYSFMKKKGLVFCTVSASNLPETIVTTESAFYLRFHGKNGIYENLYSERELKDWAEKIKKIDTKHIFCYFNNDINANAIKNCLTLKKLLNNI